MSVDVTADLKLEIAETLTTGVNGAATPIINHGGADSDFRAYGRLTSTTTPDVEGCVVKTVTLTAGAYTLDLTSMTGTNGATVDATGKKIRFLKIVNDHATQTLTVAKGASNGHTGFGSSFSLRVDGGGALLLRYGSVAVGSGDKTFDFTGTGTNTFQLSLVYG